MPKMSELMAVIPKYWLGPSDLTGRMKEAIAKVIRDDESQRGMSSEHTRARNRRRETKAVKKVANQG